LETGRIYRGHFNVRNGGAITNLPADCIIESPGFVDRFGVNMVEGITLPLACAATCNVSVSVQRMSVEAAMTGNLDLLKQAVLHDPLVGAILNPEEVWQMVDEMVVAQAKWLPQYAQAIPAARERLGNPKVRTREWSGAARLDVRSVDELRDANGRGTASEGHGLGTKSWVETGFCALATTRRDGSDSWLAVESEATPKTSVQRSLGGSCKGFAS
jgi:alpha-galactosidase